MPVYRLPEEVAFPPPEDAEADGLLCVGGDLSPERLLAAYGLGIFPWPHEGWPLLWFSPDPRMILPVGELRIQRSLKQTIRKQRFEVRFDTAFAKVIENCKTVPRPGQEGTWINDNMIAAYTEMHRLGFAHSAEAWLDDKLVGGLYGISLGAAFFGESMFAHEDDASKVAFTVLVKQLASWNFRFVDAQVHTKHLERFGARMITRKDYLHRLATALETPTRRGPWKLELSARELV